MLALNQKSILIESETRSGEMINCLHIEGDAPAIFYLCGFYSNIQGSKIQYLQEWAIKNNRALTCFDYRGHGESDGVFAESYFTHWFNDTMQIFKQFAQKKHIIIGSSMGGWMAMNLLKQSEWADKFQGAILLAPAPDFMNELLSDELIARIRVEKKLHPYESDEKSDDYDPNYVFTELMLNDAPNMHVLNEKIKAPCPVCVLHGDEDDIVPIEHSKRAFHHFTDNDDGSFHLLKGGDHSLSRPEDLAFLTNIIKKLSS